MPRLRAVSGLARLVRHVLSLLCSRLWLLRYVDRWVYTWSCVLTVLYWLVLSSPMYSLVTLQACPAVGYLALHQYYAEEPQSGQVVHPPRPVDCAAIFRGDTEEIAFATEYQWCRRPDALYESDYLRLTRDCDRFRSERGYNSWKVTREEKKFPIAFSILLHEQAEQSERLLRAIYRPQNIYCLHVDYKASSMLHRAVRGVASCLDNVLVVERPMSVHWAEISVVEAEMKCLEILWNYPVKWKYLINLTGREFPLRTNRELVKILDVYNGANDIDGTAHRRPIDWTQYVWRKHYWKTNQLKEPPPHNFVICKGSTHIAASRNFIDYVLHNKTSRDLMMWMRNIRVPDEHFFQTLNHNPHLGVPGAYKGDPDLKWSFTRFKVWMDAEGVEQCGGEWVRFVCNLGVADLPRLPLAKHMFVNKFRLELDSVAYRCAEEWYYNRTKGPDQDFDIDFYKKLNFVNNHNK